MKQFEILAPAGSMESLKAGVRCGANAVYLGGKAFSARRNAGNFNDEELREAVVYCHQRNVKVYYALNILIHDYEMQQAVDVIRNAVKVGVDAFIVQDIGLAVLAKRCFPNIILHASTQMSVVAPVGFQMLEELGFCRGVLPREASEKEIKEIRKQTSIELEGFVHGALCMCVSGQCYLSSVLGSRSGNRGLCAQPCRLPFSANEQPGNDLSLKDMSIIENLKEFGDCGVYSLKIEGRMKRAEYVAAAVTAVKKAVDGNYTHKDKQALQSVFSRSGFTDGYFKGSLGKDMFGIRQKEDVLAAKEVLSDFRHLYDNETPLIEVDIECVCKKETSISLTMKTEYKTVTVTGDIPQTAHTRSITVEELAARLSKLGGSPFFAKDVNVSLDDGLMLPASSLNGLRRKAVEELMQTQENTFIENEYKPLPVRTEKGSRYLTARFLSASQIPQNHSFERVFLPVWAEEQDFITHNAGVEIPRGIFGIEDRVLEKLKILKQNGVKNALCGSLDSYKLAQNVGFEVFGDFGLNILNSESASLVSHPILSFELTLQQANQIFAKDTGIVAYGHLPLMLTRNCPIKNKKDCAHCKKQGVLTDRMGYNFPVVCSSYPCVEILNSVPVYMGDRAHEIDVDFCHFYFSVETKEEVLNIIDLFNNSEKPSFKYTRGLYQRGVL